MRIYPVFVFLILTVGSLAAEPPHDHTYKNEEFGFSFEYPQTWGVVKDGPGSLPNDELYRVEFDRRVNDGWMGLPLMFVGVFRNPEGLELREFAARWLWAADPDEIGFKKITVNGHDALRATYFAEAGPGCATSVAFIPHGEDVIVVNPRCNSETLPQILYSFVVDEPSSEGR